MQILESEKAFKSLQVQSMCILQALQELQSEAGEEAGALRKLLLDTDMKKVSTHRNFNAAANSLLVFAGNQGLCHYSAKISK